MGLKRIRELPKGAVHEKSQDATLPNGTKIEQFRQGGRVFERFTSGKPGDRLVRVYELRPETKTVTIGGMKVF